MRHLEEVLVALPMSQMTSTMRSRSVPGRTRRARWQSPANDSSDWQLVPKERARPKDFKSDMPPHACAWLRDLGGGESALEREELSHHAN